MGRLGDKLLFLLDMDGTIYLDEEVFAGVPEFLQYVQDLGGRYLYLTNNSSKGIDEYLAKMQRLGLPAKEEDFLTSVDATIRYLRREHPGKLCYVMGTKSLLRQLSAAGIRVTDRLENGIDLLLCGFDRELTFRKLEDACILLGRGVDYVATNPDWVCPTWYGSVPDCGSVCEMLFRATGRRPVVIGKPQPEMVLLAMERTGFAPEQTVMLGDRLYTDIACGVNAGVDTVFLLSGEGVREDIETYDIHPTWIYDHIEGFYHDLKEKNI